MTISRRQFLGTAGAALLVPALPGGLPAAPPAPRPLAIERRTLEVKGRAARVFGIRQPDGTSGLTLEPGRRFLVSLANRSGEEAIIHWHGQRPPYVQDGVADRNRPTLPDGAEQLYDFAAQPGTHWMHSHFGLQEQLLMAAPLVVRSEEDIRADLQEVTVLLHDFTFRDPAEVLGALTGGMMAHGAHGGGHGGGHAMPGHGTPNHAMPQGMAMDLNDVEYDAYLANDRTLDDPEVVRVEKGGRVRLRLINGATSTAFHIELGRLTGRVVAVDGLPVEPVEGSRFGMAMGQRLDILLSLPAEGGAFPVLARREGERQRTGIVLASAGAPVARLAGEAETAAGPVDLSLERRLVPLAPPAARPADVTATLRLTGGMMPYVWTIDDQPFGEHRPLRVAPGQRVEVTMVNQSHMAHPMHLHGHHFQVVGLDGTPLAGAVRDTVLVPVGGSVTIAFDADNPGRWPLHCHNLLHMAVGMMTEVVYDGYA
ncbi:multicopper oxidase family protein [Azospirillum thermophilum]|uniref:Copper oxidase n=1 Tax=Azospirillum thermophilum TaxID=2202148 RepID=A0A2S2CWW3_9PROT|nr:multicopper oxidase domain-containing protein [Azospirillum thermophilum]AWK89002.1 copper oxidase [Azospirillum thermophilum]